MKTGAELVVQTLEEYGIKHIFGNPGTTEVPIIDEIDDSSVKYVLGLHEDIAVGMAAGYARTQTYHDIEIPVGVANLHIAPGLAHGLGNLYGAYRGGVPLVVTAGDHRTDVRHKEPALSGDLETMAEPVTKWSTSVNDISTLPTYLRRAFRTALTPPTGPVFLGLPLDVMLDETKADPAKLGEIPAAGRAKVESMERAAEVICNTDEVTLIIGDQLARSGPDGASAAVDFAEASGARVHGEILTAEINFPTAHKQWISFLSGTARKARKYVDTDVVIQVGCSTNTPITGSEEGFIPEDTTCIHIGSDPWELGKNERGDVSLLGDPGTILEDLTPMVEAKLSDSERDSRLRSVLSFKETVKSNKSIEQEESPLSKEALVDILGSIAPNAFIVDEAVTSKYVLLSRADLDHQDWMGNKGGGLGYGLPAAVGASFAENLQDNPRDVIGFVGDGSYLYYPQTVYTASRYNVDLTVVIPNNQNYRILKDNTMEILGGTEEDHSFVGMDFEPPIDIPTIGTGYGVDTVQVDSQTELSVELENALESHGPKIIDALVND